MRSDFFQRGKHFVFAFGGRKGKRAIETDLRRNGFVDESFEAGMAKQIEHLRSLIGVGSDVAIRKIGGVGKGIRSGLLTGYFLPPRGVTRA